MRGFGIEGGRGVVGAVNVVGDVLEGVGGVFVSELVEVVESALGRLDEVVETAPAALDSSTKLA